MNYQVQQGDIIRQRIRELAAEGLYLDEIARRINRDVSRVRFHARNMQLEIPSRPPPRTIRRMAREEQGEALFKARKSNTQVAAILGVHVKTAERLRYKIGMAKPADNKPKPQWVVDKAEEYMADKMPPTEISRTLGLGRHWLTRNYPEYKYSEFDDVESYAMLVKAFKRLPDRVEKVELFASAKQSDADGDHGE